MATNKILDGGFVLFSLLFYIVFLIHCSKNYDVDKTAGQLQTQIYHSKVKILGEPIITDMHLSDGRDEENKVKNSQVGVKSDSFKIKQNSYLSVSSNLSVTNIGTTTAKIWLFVTTDTLAELNELRQFLTGEQKELYLNYRLNFVSPFENSELSPQGSDSLVLNFTHTVRFKSSERFFLHYLIIYENENGEFFDTYFWNAYKFKNVEKAKTLAFKSRDIFEKNVLTNELSMTIHDNDLIYLNHSEPTYYVYDSRSSKNIRKMVLDLNDLLVSEN